MSEKQSILISSLLMQSLTATHIAQFNEKQFIEEIRTKAFSLLFDETAENRIFEYDMFNLFVIFDLCTLSKGTEHFLRIFTQLHCIQICINQFMIDCHANSDAPTKNETNLHKLVKFLALSIDSEFNCFSVNLRGLDKLVEQSMMSFFRCTAVYQSNFYQNKTDFGEENMFSK